MVWGLSNPFSNSSSSPSSSSISTPSTSSIAISAQNDTPLLSDTSSQPEPPPPPPSEEPKTIPPALSNPWHDFTTDPLDPHPRLQMSFPARLTLFTILSLSTGFLLGSAVGGPEAALRYRALNAHRLPTSSPGWYFYHKSKNYHTIVGGVKVGLSTALRMTGWGALFFVVEEIFDKAKGCKDFTSSAGAGLTMAGVWSLTQNIRERRMGLHHPGSPGFGGGIDIFTSARTARLALLIGTGFGIVQDGLMWGRGETPPYVRWVRRRVSKDKKEEEGTIEKRRRLLEEEGDAV